LSSGTLVTAALQENVCANFRYVVFQLEGSVWRTDRQTDGQNA